MIKNIIKKSLLTLTSLLCIGCNPQSSTTTLTQALKNPSHIIIDVRTQEEYDRGHIKNARHIPYENIETLNADKETPIILYCQVGGRAGIAEKTLKKLGYKTVLNAGGYQDLKQLLDSLQIKS